MKIRYRRGESSGRTFYFLFFFRTTTRAGCSIARNETASRDARRLKELFYRLDFARPLNYK